MPFEDISDSKAINFLKSLKVYKLTRFLWLHVITKLKELGLYQSIKRINQYNPPRNIKLEQVYAEKKVTTLNEELLRLKKAIELNPGNDRAYVELGNIYCTQNKFFEV
ncbi:MAG: hypothetical protein KKE64_00940, partial [Candidatus Omnitrophica bacterium]|nr:hypothetical protein [Candidatus Omnitrophota bacterium]